ncbi:MAG: hypothetical protein ACRYFR_07040 [Janthinobacterium lividum]
MLRLREQATATSYRVPSGLVTQVADPAGPSDACRFLEVGGAVVGKAIAYGRRFPVMGHTGRLLRRCPAPEGAGCGLHHNAPRPVVAACGLQGFRPVAGGYDRVTKFQAQLITGGAPAFMA